MFNQQLQQIYKHFLQNVLRLLNIFIKYILKHIRDYKMQPRDI